MGQTQARVQGPQGQGLGQGGLGRAVGSTRAVAEREGGYHRQQGVDTQVGEARGAAQRGRRIRAAVAQACAQAAAPS
jgi:hypothetical protein